ncbi:MAG: hypothetical protein ACK4F7_09070 [Inhella sp.]
MNRRPPPTSLRLPRLGLLCLFLAVAGLSQPAIAQTRGSGLAPAAIAPHPSSAFWLDLRGTPAPLSAQGRAPAINPQRFRALSLNRAALAGALAGAPREFSDAARQNPLVIALPDPAAPMPAAASTTPAPACA